MIRSPAPPHSLHSLKDSRYRSHILLNASAWFIEMIVWWWSLVCVNLPVLETSVSERKWLDHKSFFSQIAQFVIWVLRIFPFIIMRTMVQQMSFLILFLSGLLSRFHDPLSDEQRSLRLDPLFPCVFPGGHLDRKFILWFSSGLLKQSLSLPSSLPPLSLDAAFPSCFFLDT